MSESRCWCDQDPDERLDDECEIHVSCDEDCRALLDPQTPYEVMAAYLHWRRHPRLSGCSHGC